MRFRPDQHLRRQNDIRAVRERGSRSDWRFFTLWCYRRPAETSANSGPRAAVIASGAAVGRAVARNRAKRRLREVFRQQQHRLPSDCDLLLVARSAINRCSFADLQERFLAACARLQPAPPAL